MKGILPIWSRRSSQKSSARSLKSRQRRSGTILQLNQLEDRIALTTTTSYFMPSPYASGAYLPIGQVDRVRVSFINQDNPDWVIDPASFNALDVSITRNGGSPINLSNGSPGEYKIGVVNSQTYRNSFWLVGLPRAILATGDYQLCINGSVSFLDADGNTVDTETISISSGSVSWQQRGGSVATWGANASGQTNVPSALLTATNVVSVAAGADYGMALLADGTVQAWGTGSVKTNLPVFTNAVQIAGGNQFASVLRADGSITTWGTDGSYKVVTNSPASGNFFSVQAGYQTGGALGDTQALNFVETAGSQATLVTWGNNADPTNAVGTGNGAMYVSPETVQGLVQLSMGNDFMVGVRADGSFWGYGGALPNGGIPYNPDATYVQALAGAKVTGATERYALTISNDYNTGNPYTTTGYGQNNYGTVNPANVTSVYAPYISAIWDGQSANGTTNIAANVSFNINSVSRIESGDLAVVGLASGSNQIKGWGYNGGVTPDNRVTGGLAYSAPGARVGYISSGATNTIVQVMDLTAPTLANSTIVPQAPLITGTFPLKWRATFSEPIDLTTFSTATCQVVYANGIAISSGFPITGLALVSGTTSTYEISVGTAGTNPPANFNSPVYMQINNPNGSAYIRDIAGNTLANGPYNSSTGIQIQTVGLSTVAGTSFDGKQWVVAGSTINYTLAFSDYVNISQATNTSNYAFTTLTGTLTGALVTSITSNENVGGFSRSFTVQVFTSSPTPTNTNASYKLSLIGGTVSFQGGGTSGQVDSNIVVVDNVTPVITGIVPVDASGNTPASTTIVANGNNLVRFKVSFSDPVTFQGASTAVGNFFSFVTASFAGTNSITATFSSVTNTANAAYSTDWVVNVVIAGQGRVNLKVNKSYTASGSTYSIVNPVGTAVPADSTSTSGWTIMSSVYTQSVKVNTYNTNASTTVVGLNPTNTFPTYIGAPAGVTFNTAQRSRVATTQFNFYAPVANLATSTAVPVPGADFKLQVWSGDNATGSFVDYNSIATDPISINVANSWGAGTTNYYSTYDLTFRLGSAPSTNMWSLPNGVYQVVMVNPSNLRNLDGVAAANGDAAYQTQFEFYRLFGNGDGTLPSGFRRTSVNLNDYNKTLAAFTNGSSAWQAWNFFSLVSLSGPFAVIGTNSYNRVLSYYTNGAYLNGRVLVNANPSS